ncbi:MAG: glycoside hydrolase family 44 protein [bacterium]
MKRLTRSYWMVMLIGCCVTHGAWSQQVTITVNATQDKHAVSPYIYGRNQTFDQPAQFYKDAGLQLARMNGGNNASKYNWRKKISSHPDWYNNVYAEDWDLISQNIQSDFPGLRAMWAFQLLGKVASNTSNNFDDWNFNHSQYWKGVNWNLAGGGIPDTSASAAKPLKAGDISLYTQDWPADSSVEILNHWFGAKGLGLNKNQFIYWNMDNEPDVWNGTHDDVMPTLISAAEFMDRFITLAKKARALFPGIKICGPVTTSEWQWFKWGSENITVDGKYYSWLEYFIKRCADEEKTSGTRVLDVVDLHNYPYFPSDNAALQLHRMYYDETYDYPGANGLKTINGGWDPSQTKEYIFKRINNWLTQYFGQSHGITLGISEWSPGPSDPNLSSVIYASHLGIFANSGVEYFTPWNWYNGMWETMHLFSRYGKSYSVSSTSSLENTVSAYTTINQAADSMTVIIVNRDTSASRNVKVALNGLAVSDGSYPTLQLSSLPSTETFKSHTDNALKSNSVNVASNSFSVIVPSLSTTAVILKKASASEVNNSNDLFFRVYPSIATDFVNVDMPSSTSELTRIIIFDAAGNTVKSSVEAFDTTPLKLNISGLSEGYYLLQVQNKHFTGTKGFTIIR